MGLRSYIPVILMLFIFYVDLCDSDVVSATFAEVSTQFNGVDYDYALFDVRFNERVYKLSHATCGCAADLGNCFGKGDSVVVVNETGYDVQRVEVGEDYVVSLTDDVQYFKVSVDRDVDACPILVIDISQDLNGIYMYAAFGRIPSPDDYDRYSVNWSNKIMICPEDANYVFGDLYIACHPGLPLADISTASFRIRQFETEVCAPYTPISLPKNTPVYDGYTHSSLVEPDNYQFYQYRIYERCADVAIYLRGNDPNMPGDMDFFVSTTHIQPTLEDGYEWASFNDIDDYTVITNVCNPLSSSSDFDIYIGVFAFQSDRTISYDLTVTSRGNFFLEDFRRAGTYNYYLNLISSVQLDCGLDSFECQFIPYDGCQGDQPYKCCNTFFPVFPLSTGSNPFVVTVFDDLNLDDMTTRNSQYLRFPQPPLNRISFGVLKNRETETLYEKFLFESAEKCQLTWRNSLVNFKREPIFNAINFTKRAPICDTDILAQDITEYRGYLNILDSSRDINEIMNTSLSIASIPFKRNWDGCKSRFLDFSTIGEIEVSHPNNNKCWLPNQHPDYATDPCCDLNAGLSQCCISEDRTTKIQEPTSPNPEIISSECSSSRCTQKSIEEYVGIMSQSSRCSLILDDQNSLDTPEEIYSCRMDILGIDLGGKSCTIDKDCSYDAACVQGRCNNTLSDLISCISENVSFKKRQKLFDLFKIREEATVTRFEQFIEQKYVVNECTGEGSFMFRDHWEYQNQKNFCVDYCTGTDYAHCFERFCDIPPECLTTVNDNACDRYWIFEEVDGTGCLDEYACNYKSDDCTGTFEECKSLCVNETLSEYVCVVCDSDGSCTEVPVTDESLCTGQCNLAGYNDQGTCESAGSCSIACSGCDENQCSSLTFCSTETLLKPVLNGSSGMCTVAAKYDDYQTLFCDGEMYLSQCIVAQNTESDCNSVGGMWHTLLSVEECGTLTYCGEISKHYSDTECSLCNFTTENFYTVENGIWESGIWTPYYWKKRSYDPVRTIEPTLDFLKLYEDLETSTARELANIQASYAYCNFEYLIKSLTSVICDCVENGESCFSNILDGYKSKETKICSFISETKQINANTTLTVFSDTVPPIYGCIGISFSSLSIIPFRVDQDSYLASALFTKPRTNEYSVLINDNDVIVGQLAYEGIAINSDTYFIGKMILCYNFSKEDNNIDSSYSVPGIAKFLNGTFYITSNTSDGTENCFLINGTGNYYPVFLQEDWTTASNFGTWRYFVVVMYIVCLVLSFVQFTLSRYFDPAILKNQRLFLFICLVVISGTRAVFISSGFTNPTYLYILFEGPSLIFFSLYSILLGIWIRFLFAKRDIMRKMDTKWIWHFIVVFNIVLLIMLLVFVLLFSFWEIPALEECEFTPVSTPPELATLNKIYLVIILIITVMFLITFISLGVLMIKSIRKVIDQERKWRGIALVLIFLVD
eukprot:TRINITY_DN4223_c0_g1_i2.p1 TRINITY_DN4223_c0_g1~~TRINITY_DN4223_c0_g1_i2.p1  ORF type:complete len:1443 (+),score=220.00 TRINITY_DN4223_c0_g1_i2:78-4406(+)